MNKFRNCFFVILIIIVSQYTISSQSNLVKTWEILYKHATSLKEKKDKVIQIYDIATKDFEPLILDIIQEQADYVMANDVGERRLYEEWVYFAALTAGKLKMKNTAPLLKDIYPKIELPRFKGEILYMIGQTENKEMVPWLNLLLSDLNELQKAGKMAGKEDIPLGAIKALGVFNDPSSFESLFFASLFYYSEKLRILADEIINRIPGSVSVYCDRIISKERDLSLVIEALKYSFKSKSPVKDKIASAKLAMTEGLDTLMDTDTYTLDFQKRLRDEAAFCLGELKAEDKESIDLLARKWDKDKDYNSNLVTILALQKIKNELALDVLINRLSYMTQKLKEGAGIGFGKEEGGKIIIAMIHAIGEIGNEKALLELLRVTTSVEYAKPQKDEAQKAIDKINKKSN